ncbi:MAG: hypothetical protein HFH82_08455 [Lachnospiraceae bacterium]|nr:hypothetical protein [Lachnospiraceae bacterium]
MKFADKLFLSMTALLTLMFALFGIWMLLSDFSQLLDKEIEQGNDESRMFHFLFEMGYQSMEEFGDEYAINRTLGSIINNVERGGSHVFVIGKDGTYIYGGDYLKSMGFAEEVSILTSALNLDDNYGHCVRQVRGGILYVYGGVDRCHHRQYISGNMPGTDRYLSEQTKFIVQISHCIGMSDAYGRNFHLCAFSLYYKTNSQFGQVSWQDCGW